MDTERFSYLSKVEKSASGNAYALTSTQTFPTKCDLHLLGTFDIF